MGFTIIRDNETLRCKVPDVDGNGEPVFLGYRRLTQSKKESLVLQHGKREDGTVELDQDKWSQEQWKAFGESAVRAGFVQGKASGIYAIDEDGNSVEVQPTIDDVMQEPELYFALFCAIVNHDPKFGEKTFAEHKRERAKQTDAKKEEPPTVEAVVIENFPVT